MRRWNFRDYVAYLAVVLLALAYFASSWLLGSIGFLVACGLLLSEKGEMFHGLTDRLLWQFRNRRQPPRPAFSTLAPQRPSYLREPSTTAQLRAAKLDGGRNPEVAHH
jgi:hypothetical protein